MLLERWHPITKDFGLINASISACVEEFTTWHGGLALAYERKEISSFGGALEALPPLSAELARKLFVPTAAPNWTAFFQSGISGSDPSPVACMLAKLLKVVSMRICASPPGARWPAVIWEVYAPPELGGSTPLGYRRSIAASNDGGRWAFWQSGAPYAFEQSDRYLAPRKRDRFTRELLTDYLAHFGLAPLGDEFYVPSAQEPAILLERIFRQGKPSPEFTLEQVIDGLPWGGNRDRKDSQ